MSKNNILIFDSGVGGLSVFQEIANLLPSENYFYLFDNQAYPYGELAPDVLIYRTCQLIKQMMQRERIDIIVIACNSASTIVLPALREKVSIPVVGVVPAIKPASLRSKQAVGLIATPATVKRPYTHDLIEQFAEDKQVILVGSSALVDMAEQKLRNASVNLAQLENILTPLIGHIDVAVLGCTHFPLIKHEISQVLGSQVELIDSGSAIARRVEDLLKLEARENEKGRREVFSSAAPKQEAALNIALKELGFSPVQRMPIQGA